MKKAGILFSETDVTTSDIEYDSRKQKMTVDMDPTLKQIQVLPMTGGTVITDTGSGGGYSKLLCNEVLFRVQHNMPFIPKVESYYYVTKADNPPAAPSPINGTVGVMEMNKYLRKLMLFISQSDTKYILGTKLLHSME